MTLSKGSRQTLVAAVAALALAGVVAVLALSARTGAPTSLDGVKAEAVAIVDEVAGTLPDSAVTEREDTASVAACPNGSGGRMVDLERRIALDPAFDRAAWPATLDAAFPARDGWDVRTRVLGGSRDDVMVKIVGTALLIVEVRSVVGDDGRPSVTISTTSRCTPT